MMPTPLPSHTISLMAATVHSTYIFFKTSFKLGLHPSRSQNTHLKSISDTVL